MPVDVLPETSPVVVDIQTEAAGLSAPEVESLVTVPLEKNLLEGVLGVTDVTSDSVPGLSAIELHFAPGTDLLHARQLVQERLTGAFVLPNVSKPPVMLQPVSSTSDVMLVGLTSRTLSMTDMSVLARWTIVPRLLGLPGVANVSTFGQADRQLQVLLDPATLAAHDVTLGQIVETAGNAQLVSPLSFLEASTPGTGGFLEGPDQRITIQPVLPFGTPSNMAQLPVAGAASGLRLGDVATVVQGNPPLIGDGAVNGGAGLVLVVQKLPSANVLAVTREVDQALAGMRPGLPGLMISPSLFREDTYLRNSLNNLWVALIEAGALAALALIALLMRLRLAFAALFGVALSLIAATAVLSLLGYTFNALVTLGLLVALGFVVTEAAGEAQAIAARLDAVRADGRNDGRGARRRRADGVRAAGAARLVAAACGDLRGALCAASVAVVACVVPLLVATGLTASFLRPAALAFALAVVASMVVAVTVTPAIATAALAIAPSRPRVTVFGDRAGAGYARALGALARAPRRALTITAAAAAVGVAALVLLPWVHPGQPVFADRELVVRLTGPPGMSLTEMSRMTVLAARELRALPSVQEVGATDGRAVTSDQVVNTNTGELWVTLRPSANYAGAVTAVRAIASGTPGIAGTVSTYESDAMTGVLSGAPAQVVARIYGLDYRELARLAGQLRTEVAGIGGVTGTSVQLPVSQPTVDVTVNLDAAARAGISPGDVRREAGTLLSGLTVGNYFENQEVFDVVVWGTPAVRNSLSSIGNLELDSPNGGHVRLGQVASIAVRPEPADIPQEAMARYADVTASVSGSGGSAGAISDAIAGKLAALRYPAEYHGELVTGGGSADGAAAAGPGAGVATVTGLSPDSSAVAGTSRTAFVSYVVAALVAVFLIAQAVAGSWRLAALVFGSLPVSLAGGVFMVLALGATGELAAAAGLVGVFAVAVRQAIATVARLRSPRPGLDSGPGPDPAPRLAEILTPALVMAVVLAPFVALGGVPGMEMPHTAAAVMLGGLVTTTLVNLFVLPVTGQVFGARLAAGSPVVVSAADEAHPPTAQPAHAGAGGQSAVVRAQAGDRGAGFRENA